MEPDPSRIVLGRTALLTPRGQLRWTSSDLLLHEVDYGLTDQIQLGARALLPVIYIGVFPSVTLGARLDDDLYGALQVTGGIFWPYVTVDALEIFFTGRFALWGGGALITYRKGAFTMSAGLPAYGVRYGQKEFQTRIEDKKPINLSRTYFETWLLVIPHAGVTWQVSRRIRLNLEVHAPLGGFDVAGKLWVFLYGARIAGKDAFLDLSFLLPACPGAEDLLRYLPLGIPLISTGVRF